MSCKFSLKKCQRIFSGKNIDLSSEEFGHRVVKGQPLKMPSQL